MCSVFLSDYLICIGNFSYLDYNYVYGLALGCCTIIFMLPFVLFAKVVSVDMFDCGIILY